MPKRFGKLEYGVCIFISLFSFVLMGFSAEWKPAVSKFGMTRWAKDVSPDNVLPEYPRPQLVRKEWLSLNGLWDYALADKDAPQPEKAEGKILVPFAIEAPLSGVGKMITDFKGRTYLNTKLWYKRSFSVPPKWDGQRIILHFDAVDWEATVFLNGKKLGTHQGGYDQFSFDITDVLKEGENELVVSAWDPTFKGGYPRGKQIDKPGGIWYTTCSGIWQTVWLEPVAKTRIESLRMIPDIDKSSISIQSNINGRKKYDVKLTVSDNGKVIAEAKGKTGKEIELKIKDQKLWWPDRPYLYDLKVELMKRRKVLDSVESYFAMRKTSIGKDKNGIMRMMLNNVFILQNGVLDQGYWPDGNLTAPTDEALKYDVQITKKLGYNMSRKHIKIEPSRWYYWCDKLGLLVWQDLVSTGDAPNHNDTEYATSDKHRQDQYVLEMKECMNERFNHPSIVMWVLFNEGMGLKGRRLENNSYILYDDTKAFVQRTYDEAAKLDPSRLLDHESGMPMGPNQGRNPIDMGIGHVVDCHSYGTTRCMNPTETRASVIGEYRGSISKYAPLVKNPGVSGLVFTQISDVENEKNGLLTYTREPKQGMENQRKWNLEWAGKYMNCP